MCQFMFITVSNEWIPELQVNNNKVDKLNVKYQLVNVYIGLD